MLQISGTSRYAIPMKRNEQVAAAVRRRAQKVRAVINELKSVPCMDCGGVFPPECMDFDHTEDNKTRNVGSMTTYSIIRVLEEADKCDIVCANCHRVRTERRRRATRWQKPQS